jgi:murein DD-endopeptidase MepM/ murein hydrolase activator NlpD
MVFWGSASPRVVFAAKKTASQHRQAASTARKKAEAAEAKADKLADEIKALDEKADALARKAAALAPRVAAASKKSKLATAELKALQKQATELQTEIESTQAELAVQQDALNARAVERYRSDDDVLLTMLFDSESLSDFIARAEFAVRVIEDNSRIAGELTVTTRKLANEKDALDKVVAEAAEKQKAAKEAADELKALQKQRKQAAANAEALEAQKTGLMKDAKNDAAKLRAMAEAEEAEAAKLERELAGSGSGAYKGKMTWPVPGYSTITSPFGWRICPFHGRELHPGVDISGSGINGAKIVAAGAGKVISAGYRGGYGYTVIIDHGNGVTTLYAHQQAGGIRVSVGQKVKAGQRIGTVGSTGSSTGPHLHWEVRVNGSPKNPLSY